MTRLVVEQLIDAPVQPVWDAVTDWPAQSEWVLATTVVAGPDGGRRVGGQLEAITGLRWRGRRLGVRDPMVVVEWDPPRRCVVDHLGSVVRGRGIIEVVPLAHDRTRLSWVEDVDLPLGWFGELGWRLAAPVAGWGIHRSLRRFAALVESGARAARGASGQPVAPPVPGQGR